jgi:Leucine-rich repeat (LRR) protein
LTYPSRSSAEERAVQWLIDDDLNTTVADEQSLRQRYALGTLWFLQTTPTTSFGSADHASTWTTNIDECKWLGVAWYGSGVVTSLYLWDQNFRGKIPADLGLLTDLTILSLSGNQLSGTIPSSLGALTALHGLWLWDNQLFGTIPSSLGALAALTGLYLNSNQMPFTIPSSLGTLTALTSLWL